MTWLIFCIVFSNWSFSSDISSCASLVQEILCIFFSLTFFFPLHTLSFFRTISVNRELSFQSSALSYFSQIPDKSLNVTVNVSAAGSEMEKFYTNQFSLVPSDQERNVWMRSCHVNQTLSADSGTVIANNILFFLLLLSFFAIKKSQPVICCDHIHANKRIFNRRPWMQTGANALEWCLRLAVLKDSEFWSAVSMATLNTIQHFEP